MIAGAGYTDRQLSEGEVSELLTSAFETVKVDGQRVLIIIPDSTRTAPMPMLFRQLVSHLGGRTAKLDFLIALGTHPPMSEEHINRHLGITAEQRSGEYEKIGVFNHRWDIPDQLKQIGIISADELAEVSEGRLRDDVPVIINKMAFEYDRLILCGPVFPHEVAGFSGGNKYLFPGIAASNIINTSHWLGALMSNPKINGTKDTPVRRIIDRAAEFVTTDKLCIAFVVKGDGLSGMYIDSPEQAWSAAADLSDKLHIVYKDRPFKTVLSCAPPMYDDIWVAGKCMYKLEPVVADGGELIIYAPHIKEISFSHGKLLREIGYHVRDYFVNRWDEFKHYPWGIIAHSTHVRGIGECTNGHEKPRVTVTLATGIDKAECEHIGLAYRDPATIDPATYADREDEGILLVPKAGEMLYRLNNPPAWQVI